MHSISYYPVLSTELLNSLLAAAIEIIWSIFAIMSKRYDSLGVSASKNEVHQAIRSLDKGLYPGAFCKILPDICGNDDEFCNVMHADTAGTKTALAYLRWKENADLGVWHRLAQDALVMNLDDLACVGATQNIIVSSTIGRNKHIIPAEVIEAVIEGNKTFLDTLKSAGIRVHYGGGETADVGDIVRTIDVGITAFCRMKREDLILPNITPGNVIVGFSSSGQSAMENEYNSGIGSNGLTAARHDLLSKYYAENFPETYSPQSPYDAIYSGDFKLSDKIKSAFGQFEVGDLLTSPTRCYLPMISKIIETRKKDIAAFIHCTGGGQTKVKKFARNVKIIKDQLFDLPPLFAWIQQKANYDLSEMYEIYNMGHRMEVYTSSQAAPDMIEIAKSFEIEAKIIGRVEESHGNTQILIQTNQGNFDF